MLAWNKATWGRATAHNTLRDVTTGIIAGTKVATEMGWRVVEAVTEGDKVLTFDGGLQTVISVRRDLISADPNVTPMAHWPLDVPADALGNREAMRLLPAQSILVESDTAEDVLGDPFALIPAASLDGFRGISRPLPGGEIEIVHLEFAQDEIVFANLGALFLCKRSASVLSDMLNETAQSPYQTLSAEEADVLVGFLEVEDEGRRAPARSATRMMVVAA